MFDFTRNLPPIEIDEFTAAVAIEALEWHMGHLADERQKGRDAVDRKKYETARLQLVALHSLWRLIGDHLRDLGAASPEAVAEMRRRTEGANAGIPRSPANAHILRAERVAREAARAEHKAANAERIEAGRRMAGGKWARPRIVFVDDAPEVFNQGEPEGDPPP